MSRSRLALLIALAVSLPLAAAEERRVLFYSSFAQTDAKKDGQSAPKRWRAIEPDFTALSESGLKKNERKKVAKKLTASVFDDVVLHLELDTVEKNGSGVFIWTGRVEGDDLSSVTISIKDKSMVALIATRSARYVIEPRDKATHEALELDMLSPVESDPMNVTSVVANAVTGPITVNDSAAFVDILVVYTDDLRAALGSTAGAETFASNAVATANTAYENSGVTFRLRLAGTMEVSYDDNGNSSNALSALQGTSDGVIDDVHARREQVGADTVAMIVLNTTNNGCGIAYTMTSTPSAGFAPYAFAVVVGGCALGNLSFAHEVGHNFGLQHDRFVTSNTGAYPYAYGYVDSQNAFRDIMAYVNKCGSCPRIQYFSNPNLTYLGRPLGISYDSSPSEAADNVLALNNAAPTLANWRQSTNPYEPPTFTDDPLVAGTTIVKALHITELRTAIDTYRVFAGLSAYSSWTSIETGAAVEAAHIEELRNALTPALTAEGITASYTDASLTGINVKAVHIEELRDYLQ